MEYLTLENLKEKTTVFEDTSPAISSVSWLRCNRIKRDLYQPSEDDFDFRDILIESQEGLDADYSEGLVYFVMDPVDCGLVPMSANQLPTEFFNHQLFEYASTDKEPDSRVWALMEEWGLLFSPLRNDWGCLDGWQFLETMSMQGVRETDVLVERMPNLAGLAVSKLEAETTFAVLKEIVLFLRKYIRNEDARSLSMLARPLAAASCNPFQVVAPHVPTETEKGVELVRADVMRKIKEETADLPEPTQAQIRESLETRQLEEFPMPLRKTGMLTSAVCNQILDTIAIADVPWRECACDGCDVIFKYSQSNAVSFNQDAYYCCPTHGARQRKRNSRKKPKG